MTLRTGGDRRWVRAPAARAAAAGDELVLLHLDRGSYYSLNETGAFVWEKLASGATEAELVLALVERFDVDDGTACRDLAEVLDELEREGLVTPAPAAPAVD